jgi:hypothetical protein
MRLVVTGWFLAVAGVASTTMMSFVDGFSIQDLQNYQKAPKGLGSPHNGLLLSQPQSPFRMETTRRDTIQMPSQTPMVPWKVSVWVCAIVFSAHIYVSGPALPLSFEAIGSWNTRDRISFSNAKDVRASGAYLTLFFCSGSISPLGTGFQCGSIHRYQFGHVQG